MNSVFCLSGVVVPLASLSLCVAAGVLPSEHVGSNSASMSILLHWCPRFLPHLLAFHCLQVCEQNDNCWLKLVP